MRRIWLVLISAVLGAGIAVALFAAKCRPVKPPAVVRVDTLITGGDTVIVTRPDPVLSALIVRYQAQVQALGDSLASERLRVESWFTVAQLLEQYVGTLNDSLAAALARRAWAFLDVRYQRGRLDLLSHRDGQVSATRARSWRSTWQLTATPAGPVLRERRLPFDFGLEAGLALTTPPADWQPQPWGYAGLTARRDWLTWHVGAGTGWPVQPRLVAGVRAGVGF